MPYSPQGPPSPPERGRDRSGDSETKKELRLARISLCIVWLFIFCHIWKLIPTAYETFVLEKEAEDNPSDDDRWPKWMNVVMQVSNTLITINSSLNFLIYVLL